MLPQLPPLVRCRNCRKCYWLTSAKKIGSISEPPIDSLMRLNLRLPPTRNIIGQLASRILDWACFAYRDLKRAYHSLKFTYAYYGLKFSCFKTVEAVEEAVEKEYHIALKETPASISAEKQMRILAWWRHTGPISGDLLHSSATVDIGLVTTEAYRNNLTALLALLNDDDKNDLLTKAEVFRNLGNFEAAKSILDRIASLEEPPSTQCVTADFIEILRRGASIQYNHVASQLRALCDERKTEVVALKPYKPPTTCARENLSLNYEETVEYVCNIISVSPARGVGYYIAAEVHDGMLCTTRLSRFNREFRETLPLKLIELDSLDVSLAMDSDFRVMVSMTKGQKAIASDGGFDDQSVSYSSHQFFNFQSEKQASQFRDAIDHLARLCGAAGQDESA